MSADLSKKRKDKKKKKGNTIFQGHFFVKLYFAVAM